MNAPATTSGRNAVAVQQNPRAEGFKYLLTGPGVQNSLAADLPKHLKGDRFVRVALAAMTAQPKLFDCTPESVLLSLMQCASMGLEPSGGVLGQAYLIPFKNICQVIPGYRGLVKLARNSGEVADVWAEVVYAKDRFDYELGLEPKLVHKLPHPEPGANCITNHSPPSPISPNSVQFDPE